MLAGALRPSRRFCFVLLPLKLKSEVQPPNVATVLVKRFKSLSSFGISKNDDVVLTTGRNHFTAGAKSSREDELLVTSKLMQQLTS